MAKGTITTKPTATGHGARVTVYENPEYALNRVDIGASLDLYFFDPQRDNPGNLNVGDKVAIDIESKSLCRFQQKLDR